MIEIPIVNAENQLLDQEFNNNYLIHTLRSSKNAAAARSLLICLRRKETFLSKSLKISKKQNFYESKTESCN